MPDYLLQAGNTPALSFHEAKAVIGSSVEQLTERVLSFAAASDEAAKNYFDRLGASIRLAKIESPAQEYDEQALEMALADQLTVQEAENIQFGVAQWGDDHTERISLVNVKKALKKQGLKPRFIEGSRYGLSAAVLLHQEVTELIVFQQKKQIILAKTLAVQDIDHWSAKDRAKPYADRKKGMLPPKLARAMVNLAVGETYSPDALLYDPFCGTGTVLMEALEVGLAVVGSDLDEKSMLGSKTNLAWLADRFALKAPFTVFQKDVAHVTADQLPKKADYLVTEPFLGKPQPKPNDLPGMFRGLEKLYLGAFRQWTSLLTNGAAVVVIFPRVELADGTVFDCRGLIDKLQAQGYTLQVNLGELRYHREKAIVQRDIALFSYSPEKK